MQTMFSSIKSVSWGATQNRCATSDINTTTTHTSLLKGNLKHDQVEISPRFTGGKKLTYLSMGETHQGKEVQYEYADCISTGRKGVFIKGPNQEQLFVQIKESSKTKDTDKKSMPPPAAKPKK